MPGLEGLHLRKLCDHYGASSDDFYTCDDAYRYAKTPARLMWLPCRLLNNVPETKNPES